MFFNIIGIDPGVHLGTSILTVNSNTLEICGIEATTIELDSKKQHGYRLYDNHVARLLYLKNVLQGLFMLYNPRVLSIEKVFVNHLYANSCLILSQYLGIIQVEAVSFNRYMKMFLYAPKEIKSTISNGSANKENMKDMLAKVDVITSCININNLDEHEIDAIVIAYTAYLEIYEKPYLL